MPRRRENIRPRAYCNLPIPSINSWHFSEIAMGRRRRNRPFQCGSTPWIHRCFLAFEDAVEKIVNEDKLKQQHDHHRNCCENSYSLEIWRSQVRILCVIRNPSMLTCHSNQEQWQKQTIERNYGSPEMNFIEGFIQHPAKHFRKPKRYGGKHT